MKVAAPSEEIRLTASFQAIKGMNDILPLETPYWQHLESTLRQVAQRYGYQEIRFPVLEQTHLFSRTIGAVTDIVEKEMYTFSDRNGDSLTLRPEGTVGCVRAMIEHNLLRANPWQRLWYMGPMFRHENPQKGRYRQFSQFGVEAFGMPGPDIDAEQILLAARVWEELGIAKLVRLEINSLGSAENRAHYRAALVDYLRQHYAELDSDSKRRLETNPLRILDSKNPEIQRVLTHAPKLFNFLDPEAKNHFAGLQKLLDHAGIKYEINPHLVRGLDYYGLTVYEWVTDQLGAQATVCAGGRYNSLVEQLGGNPTPAVGFAMGLDRLALLLQTVWKPEQHIDAYLIMVGEAAQNKGQSLAEQLRVALPEFKLMCHCGEGSFKNQFKRADKSGATWALIMGDDEINAGVIALKNLREQQEQQKFTLAELIEFFKAQQDAK